MDTKNLLWYGVATLILVAMVYVADINKVIDALSSADLKFVFLALILGFSVFIILSNTWHEFLNKTGLDISRISSFRLFMAGEFMNSITPLGQFGGEPFMAYIIKRNTDLSYEKAFSTVLSADIINGMPTLTFILGGAGFLLLFGSINNLMLQAVYAAFMIIAIGGPLVYALWFRTGTVEGIIVTVLQKISDTIGRGQNIVESVDERMDEIENAFDTIGENPRHLLETAAITHIYFLLQVGCLYLVLVSLGIDPDFTPLYFVIVISGLANFTPTPGGSGAFEATMAFLIATFVPAVTGEAGIAVAAAVLYRLCTYWPGIIAGYISITGLKNGGAP
ncbi:MAG: flippase-like domain-containing protein [Nanohaloarchaea archaeon]|nr:flippase-like domain-containing protein [Candidatus Nanohaloarchaea archaeon]